MTISEFESIPFVVSSFVSPQHTLSDEEINTMYLSGEIRIVTEQARYPLKTISSMFSKSDYNLKPDFQRRHRWDVVKQSRLIESFIMNVPIPPIFLYEEDFSEYEVMDGLQRITAIKEFYEDKYALDGLELWPDLNGRKYSDLPDQIRKGIDRRYLSSIILLKETAKSPEEAKRLKQMVFARINSGGAKLEDQENRNAMYSGNFNQSIILLARDQYFCEIFDIPQASQDEDLDHDILSEELKNNRRFKTMKDVEIVLRFFAMRMMQSWRDVTLKEYLNQFSSHMMDAGHELIQEYESMFRDTIKLAYDMFGNLAFCMWKKSKVSGLYRWTKTPSMTIYDPLMKVLSDYLSSREQLIANADAILDSIRVLHETDDRIINGRNTTPSDVEYRILKYQEIINRYAS